MKWQLGIGLALLNAGVAGAFEPIFEVPAQVLADKVEPQSVLMVPAGPFLDGQVPGTARSGAVRKRSWRFPGGFGSTATQNATLAAQLLDQGYELLLSCDAATCGGFDFRFGIEVMLPPDMFVDLSDYYFLSGERQTDAGPEGVTILISQSLQSGLLQVITVSPREASTPLEGVDQSPSPPQAHKDQKRTPSQSQHSAEVQAQLARSGHVVLDDLSFETGASQLTLGSFPSLKALAEYLNQNEARKIALVGHTDSQGSLEANTGLSQKRAESVKAHLVTAYGVNPEQVEARGAGYLAPVASNLSAEGRRLNRRVEAVLLADETQE